MKYPETMPIEVGITSNKPQNIILTMFDAKQFRKHNFNFFGPKAITNWNVLT